MDCYIQELEEKEAQLKEDYAVLLETKKLLMAQLWSLEKDEERIRVEFDRRRAADAPEAQEPPEARGSRRSAPDTPSRSTVFPTVSPDPAEPPEPRS